MTETHERNPGTALERGWFEDVQVNRSASERRAATIAAASTEKKDYQAAWLLRAIQCIDLTTLAGDDTPGRVRRLCNQARNPVRQDILDRMGVGDIGLKTGAVCVYPTMVPHAVKALQGTGIPVASVATGAFLLSSSGAKRPPMRKLAGCTPSSRADDSLALSIVSNR